MENLKSIVSQFLSCGYLDVQFFDDLIWAYDIDLDLYEISVNYGKIDNINILIYETYEQIKDMFFDENEEAIEALGFDTSAAESWEDYEIITNYLCSSLQFSDERIEKLYQNWRKY